MMKRLRRISLVAAILLISQMIFAGYACAGTVGNPLSSFFVDIFVSLAFFGLLLAVFTNTYFEYFAKKILEGDLKKNLIISSLVFVILEITAISMCVKGFRNHNKMLARFAMFAFSTFLIVHIFSYIAANYAAQMPSFETGDSKYFKSLRFIMILSTFSFWVIDYIFIESLL